MILASGQKVFAMVICDNVIKAPQDCSHLFIYLFFDLKLCYIIAEWFFYIVIYRWLYLIFRLS